MAKIGGSIRPPPCFLANLGGRGGSNECLSPDCIVSYVLMQLAHSAYYDAESRLMLRRIALLHEDASSVIAATILFRIGRMCQ